jgi:hypothetical protein
MQIIDIIIGIIIQLKECALQIIFLYIYIWLKIIFFNFIDNNYI